MNPGTQPPLEHDDARGNDLALVEAALFLSTKPMSRRALATILGGVAQAYVDDLLVDLAESYNDPIRGIELHIKEGRSMLRVKSTYVDRVAHLAPQQDIPRPVLRTLAVIAYNNPMTQADVIRVRGNKGYAHIQRLLDRRLVRAEDHGRTLLLHVTAEFLRHFGLSSVEEFQFQVSPPADTPEPIDADANTLFAAEGGADAESGTGTGNGGSVEDGFEPKGITDVDDAPESGDDPGSRSDALDDRPAPIDAYRPSKENDDESFRNETQSANEDARNLENGRGG